MSSAGKYLSIYAIAFLFTSCTAIGVVSDLNSVTKTTHPCYDNLKDNPEYAVLYKKLALFRGEFPTDAQLADQERPSPEVIQAAMDWWAEDQVCIKSAMESYSNMDAEFGAKVGGWFTEAAGIFNYAVGVNPPYGSLNARIKHLRERQKKDVNDWIQAEVKRRSAQTQPATTDFLTGVLSISLQALTRQQIGLFHTQKMYSQRIRTYRPVDLMKTSCNFEGKKFVCRNDPLMDGVKVEDVMKGIQQFQQIQTEQPR